MSSTQQFSIRAREDEMDAAAGQGFESFVSFLKSTAREIEADRCMDRVESSSN